MSPGTVLRCPINNHDTHTLVGNALWCESIPVECLLSFGSIEARTSGAMRAVHCARYPQEDPKNRIALNIFSDCCPYICCKPTAARQLLLSLLISKTSYELDMYVIQARDSHLCHLKKGKPLQILRMLKGRALQSPPSWCLTLLHANKEQGRVYQQIEVNSHRP